MAHVSQELKKQLAPAIKEVLKQYGLKGSIAVSNHSTLVVNVKSGDIDFANSTAMRYDHISGEDRDNNGRDHYQVNPYHIESNWEGTAQKFLIELNNAMNVGNFDKSDIQTDYFHVGWYTEINIGQWNKPYQLNTEHFGGMAIVEHIEITDDAQGQSWAA